MIQFDEYFSDGWLQKHHLKKKPEKNIMLTNNKSCIGWDGC